MLIHHVCMYHLLQSEKNIYCAIFKWKKGFKHGHNCVSKWSLSCLAHCISQQKRSTEPSMCFNSCVFFMKKRFNCDCKYIVKVKTRNMQSSKGTNLNGNFVFHRIMLFGTYSEESLQTQLLKGNATTKQHQFKGNFVLHLGHLQQVVRI